MTEPQHLSDDDVPVEPPQDDETGPTSLPRDGATARDEVDEPAGANGSDEPDEPDTQPERDDPEEPDDAGELDEAALPVESSEPREPVEPDETEDDTALRESHAWQVSADAVRSLPADDAVVPPEKQPAPGTSNTGSEPDVSSTPPTPGPNPHAPARPTGWAALGSALRPRATRAQVLAGVLCAVLGFAIVVQLRQNGDSALSQLRQDDLVRLLDESSTRSDQLSREAADLQRERDQLVSGSNTRQAAIDAARRSAATQGILAGRLPAVGPGVRITVSDNGGSVRPITMLNMLEELRNAGAEAVQLNEHRITASSAFTGSNGAVQLDGTTLTAPYVWLVIGDPDTIATALEIPGGAMAYVRNDGGSGSVDKLTEVHVDALRTASEPRYATPVAVPGS